MPRGSKKGERRGGRQAGTPNHKTRELFALMEEKFPGYHPIIQMAGIAQDESVEIGHRIMCHKEVAQYLYPKRKAVDHTVEDSLQMIISPQDAKLM